MGLKNLSEFINFYLSDQPIDPYMGKTYSERQQDLKENINYFFENGIINHNLKRLHNPTKLKENWLEIRNINVFKEALRQIVKFIDNPTYTNLEIVKWFANEFHYSKKITIYESLYQIFNPLRETDNLGKAVTPMIKEILIAYDKSEYGHISDDDIESEYEDDDRELIIETSDSD